MWRRQHDEGPIDDRWSTLQLEKDPVNGDIMVLECRREWLVDECSSTRTSYRTVLRFSDLQDHSNDDPDSNPESGTENNGIPPIHPCSASTIALAKRQRESSEFHRGDNGSTTPAITLSQCFIRSYNHSCETFIDLVNDPDASESMTRRLQLRSISRSSHVGNNPWLQEPLAGSSEKQPLQLSTLNKTSWWPPKIDISQNTTCLAEVDTLLNPKDHNTYDPISGIMDDRSIIYAVGSNASQSKKPLVFISFDPAIRLPNLNYWPGGPKSLRRTRPKTQGDGTTDPCLHPTPQSLPTSEPTLRNCSSSEGSCPDPGQPLTSLRPDTCKLDAPTWLRRTPAAYLQSAYASKSFLGFNFAYGGDHSTACRS
ncbi:f-box domain-containing protein [Colletotrichum incanum]|uniref:F-box domain-containing protein n=1 Tax=Colletotrichum incanum TaxID=1573173 RepID=A0A162NP05_COLIC|nr:f-box domain-containing protein [Colletotrichum incanum]